MGMDVYGANPTIRKQVKSKILEKVGYTGDDEWYERWKVLSEKDKSKYSDARRQQERDNPGIYFRNSCWGWRPLWDYVYSLCDDFISESRWDGGHANSGESFTKEEARMIAARLYKSIHDGSVSDFVNKRESEGYGFNKDNVKAFADFCKDSGGFEIC